LTGNVNHVGEVVVLSQAGTQEHPADVDVVSDVAAAELANRDSEITFQDFDRHRRLFLADAGETVETPL
jgi:hypothetical protein